MVPVERENSPAKFLFFVTAQGIVKRVPIEEFENIRQSAKIAINLREGDELISAKPTTGSSQILIAAANGRRFVSMKPTSVQWAGPRPA